MTASPTNLSTMPPRDASSGAITSKLAFSRRMTVSAQLPARDGREVLDVHEGHRGLHPLSRHQRPGLGSAGAPARRARCARTCARAGSPRRSAASGAARPGVLERLGQRGLQILEVDGLAQEVERPAVHRRADVAHVAVGRDDDHLEPAGLTSPTRARKVSPSIRGMLMSVMDHRDVRVLAQLLQRVLAVRGEDELVDGRRAAACGTPAASGVSTSGSSSTTRIFAACAGRLASTLAAKAAASSWADWKRLAGSGSSARSKKALHLRAQLRRQAVGPHGEAEWGASGAARRRPRRRRGAGR